MFRFDPKLLVGRSHKQVGGAGSSRTTGSDRLCSEAITVQALMDLALPRFEGFGRRASSSA